MGQKDDREFIQGMLRAISSIYKTANKEFSDEAYKLATDPNMDFVSLRDKFNQICKDYGIPVSEGIKKFQDRMNEVVQREEDLKLTEDKDIVQEVAKEEVEDREEINVIENEQKLEEEKAKEELEEIVEEEQLEEEPIEVLEEQEEVISNNTVDYTNKEVTLEMGPSDTVDSMGKQLLDLKAKGIAASVLINGVLLSNNYFDNIDQMKSSYYYQQSQNLKDLYSTAMDNKNANDHVEMAIITPKGEDNKRMVMINNSNNPSTKNVMEFTDGKDFDQYVMPNLIDSFIGDGNKISEVDDELGITRGSAFANKEEKDRYLYMAQMSNGNQIALNMAADSIDKAKSYINERLEVVTEEINKEANSIINNALENEAELEKANNKVKQLNLTPPSSTGFISGLGIGALVGVGIVIILIILYFLKIF